MRSIFISPTVCVFWPAAQLDMVRPHVTDCTGLSLFSWSLHSKLGVHDMLIPVIKCHISHLVWLFLIDVLGPCYLKSDFPCSIIIIISPIKIHSYKVAPEVIFLKSDIQVALLTHKTISTLRACKLMEQRESYPVFSAFIQLCI